MSEIKKKISYLTLTSSGVLFIMGLFLSLIGSISVTYDMLVVPLEDAGLFLAAYNLVYSILLLPKFLSSER
ncbi:MAG: hypothetical protein NT016_00480 [Candidatus Aenigmarchaeota archaeon]|nr:hypothetical protein [Candidatus Aenigmarchaeota archaeon]